MTRYKQCVQQPAKMLGSLESWLEEATEYAKTKEFEPDVLLGLRLSPDMFPLLRQLQSAADAAKFLAARLGGKEPPKHEDDETSLEQIRARIATVIEYLGTFEESDFEGANERLLELGFLPDNLRVRGDDYMREFALPNFYFHVTTAYGILRSNGVRLGKRTFIGDMSLQEV